MKLLSKKHIIIFIFSLIVTTFLYTGNSFGSITTNESGIPTVDYGYVKGVFIGKQLNPVTITQKALYYESEYQKGNESCKQLFLNNANYLVENAVQHDNYTVWQYNFPWPPYGVASPWVSAMAQGQGIRVLIHAYNMTGDKKYLNSAQLALNSFYVEVKDGGVTYKDQNGWWYEEYVTGTHVQPRVLNGMIYSLFGIYEYYEFTGDQDAKFLFDQGILSLKNNLYKYDRGNWTSYDAFGGMAPISYHEIHISQMLQLYEITKDPFFEEYYEKFQRYEQDRNNATSSSSTITDGYNGTANTSGLINYQISPTYTLPNQYLNPSKIYSLNVNVTPIYTKSNPYDINTSGLVEWYKFDDGSGITPVDSSGNGYNSVCSGSGMSWVNGKYNKAMKFNSNGYVNIPAPLCNATQCTVIAWVNETSYHQYGSFVSDMSGSKTVFNLGYENPQGTVHFYVGHNTSIYNIANSNFTNNKWHMLAGTYDSINGAPYNCPLACWVDTTKAIVPQASIQLNSDSSGYPEIGRHSDSFYVNAAIDNVMIFNRTLSDAEILRIYYDGLQQLQLNTSSNTTKSGYINGSGENIAVPYGANDTNITGFTATVPSTVNESGITINNYTDNVMPFYLRAVVPY